jgi:SAM-dependent methyltransferase
MGVQQTSYYSDKLSALCDVFGTERVEIEDASIVVDGVRFPIVDDVIVLLPADRYPKHVVESIGASSARQSAPKNWFASDVQYSFGEEWQTHPGIVGEHEMEFRSYFDLIDVESLTDSTVCDLGCGSGRWSYYLTGRCRRLILVDFSDAIFVARHNLRDSPDALFFLGDLTDLPFRRHFADLVICIGVLHHLPIPALYSVRRLKKFAPRILAYIYYALDNRPGFWRPLLAVVTGIRFLTWRVRGARSRATIAWSLALTLYAPILALGRGLDLFRIGRFVPLYETYKGDNLRRIKQDVYDRFFTRIEQRVTKPSILRLRDTFSRVTISPNLPYWHFLCESDVDDETTRRQRSEPFDDPIDDRQQDVKLHRQMRT